MTDGDGERRPLGFLLVRLGEAVDRRFVDALASLQLRPRELRALVVIAREPGCSQRELARRMPADPGNLVGLLDQLETRSLVTRRPATRDRRRRTLELTSAGNVLLAQANEATRDAEREVLAALSTDERDTLEAIALRVWRATLEPPPRAAS